MAKGKTLDELRRRIDELDAELLRLLNERGALAVEIWRTKRLNSHDVYDPARESQVIRRVTETNRGPLSDEAVRAIYKEIISACRAVQSPVGVAFLGPEGSYSHLAAKCEFGSSARLLPRPSIESVFDAVQRGEATCGVVPVENSTEGSVGRVLDLVVDSPLHVCAEVLLGISHCLLTASGTLDAVRVVASHPQALGQCRRWLLRNLPRAELLETPSTSSAAGMAARRPEVAAIAPEHAAEIYGLRVAASGIEDNPRNYTRFWVLGTEIPPPTGRDKTSIVFSLKHTPGALSAALAPFGERGVNLTRIESRPSKERPWEYLFFVDFQGHVRDDEVRSILDEVEESCIFLKVLGSYPSHGEA